MNELPAVSVYYIEKSLEMLNRATILHETLGYIGSVGLVYYSCLHICAAFVGIDKPTLTKVHAKELIRAYKRKYNSSVYSLMDNGTSSLSYWKGLREYSYYNHYHDNNFKSTADNHDTVLMNISIETPKMLSFLQAHFKWLNEHKNCSYHENISL
jgi:hypothetical protein